MSTTDVVGAACTAAAAAGSGETESSRTAIRRVLRKRLVNFMNVTSNCARAREIWVLRSIFGI
jgi:hypothetical protein